MPSVFPSRLRRWPLALLGLVATLLFTASYAVVTQQAIQAHAPVEILATHLHAPTGLARDPGTGDLFIAEADTGVILRLNPQGSLLTFATGFKQPRGLARDPRDGSLLVVDEKAGTLSRISPTGAITRLRDDLKSPQWVAVADDGTVYVTAEKGAGFKLPGHEEGLLLQLAPDGANPQLLVKGLKRPAGLRVLPDGRVRFVADRWRREPERDGGTVFEYTPGEDTEVLVRAGFKRPHDLSLDRLEATYLTADRQKEEGRRDKGVIGKSFSGEGVALFATGLQEPQGLVLDPQGNLYVAEAEAGRILRFLAPRPPTLDPPPPAFTKEATRTLAGTAEPNALLTVRGASVPLPPQTDVSSQVTVRSSRPRIHPRTGLATQTLTLTNTGPTPLAGPLAVVVTGITPPEAILANATTTVQGHPAVELPLVEGLLRPGETAQVVLQFRGLKHNQHLTFTREVWALRPLAVSDAEGHFSFPVALTPNTETHLELFATAAFGLGLTSAPANVTVTQDDQPPAVTITGGPEGEIGVPEATFTFSGTDNLTPPEQLEFAWRLDGAPWSAFSGQRAARVIGLGPGPHLFEVKARDLAGNESSTLAQRPFTVSALQLTITEPAHGAIINADRVLVKGTVAGVTGEVGVVVNGAPAAVNGSLWAVQVPLEPGAVVLTAIATDARGATASASISLTVPTTPLPPVSLEGFPSGGVAPLRVTWRVRNNTARALVQFEFDETGRGTFGPPTPTFDGVTTTYPTQGLFAATLRATDDQGQGYTATTVISVGGVPALDVKWEGMKDALRRGDIPAALAFIHSTTRARYEATFRRLAPTQLASIDQYLTTISPVEIGPNGAEYEMHRTRDGQTLSFAVWFQVDSDGLWRIRMF